MIDNLSEKQREIVYSNDKKIIVLSSPASGKTHVLTQRVKRVLLEGATPEKVVVITFTNSAAEEMKDRLGDIAKGCFIGTIHSYANYLLISKGIDTQDYISQERFDELFELVAENPQCRQDVDMLFLDEAQDSSEEQFDFIFKIINPKSYFIVGDLKQSIYSFGGARPDLLLRQTGNKGVKVYKMIENYRNGEKILNFAKNILKPLGWQWQDDSIPMSNKNGCVVQIDDDDSILEISNQILDSYDDYKDWFVLTRTNAQLNQVLNIFKEQEIPCQTFKKADFDSNKGLKEAMNNNTVKILTIHTAKGLESKNVAVIGANFYSPEERRVSYVAATRAKEKLVWVQQIARWKKKEMLEVWE